MYKGLLNIIVLFIISILSATAYGNPYWQFEDNTRYMALGDSLSAGYGANPSTRGFVYTLVETGAFERQNNLLLSNAGVIGATSRHVLDYQVPQALEAFRPDVITITMGGNDLERILNGEDSSTILWEFQQNLQDVLFSLRTGLPDCRIYVANLYTIPEIPGADYVVPLFNNIVAATAAAFSVPVADLYSEFLGQEALLLIYRKDAFEYEVHPSNAGHRAIADAFKAVIE